MLRSGAVLLLMALVQSAGLPTAPLNPDFESVAAGAPSGWMPNGQSGYRFESVAGRHGKAGRLSLVGTPAAHQAMAIWQQIDAAPYRGRHIRFRASLKVSQPGEAVGMMLTVMRPEPKALGFYYAMRGEPIGAGDWTDYAIDGRVPADAVQITIGVYGDGDADVTIDDVSLESVPLDPTPPSPEAAAYLSRALDLVRAKHIDSAGADWTRIAANAREDIAGAKTPRDVYPAIRGILGALGEKHSFLIPASVVTGKPVTQGGAAALPPPPAPMPVSELLDGKYGVVRLPELGTFGPGGTERGAQYSRTLRTALETMDKAPLCGWIVDLRGNGGGNMWPMLAGLDPLLGAEPFGYFVEVNGSAGPWLRGMFGSWGPGFTLDHAKAPVAVLLGPRTASSGEMTAVALLGRPGVRSFGGDTGAYTTANVSFPLSDGALLMVTGSFVRDRLGRDYREAIVPDAKTAPEAAEEEAKRWLASQCPKAR